MLCSKALKVAKAAFFLIVGLGAVSASAAIILMPPGQPNTKNSPAVYADETLTAKASGVTTLSATGGIFSVSSTLGAALPSNGRQDYYFRLDLVPTAGGALQFARDLEVDVQDAALSDIRIMVPGANPEDDPVPLQQGNLSRVFGGGSGSSFAVFQLAAFGENATNGVVPDGAQLELDLNGERVMGEDETHGLQARGAAGNGSYGFELMLRVYDDYSEAIRGGTETFGQDVLTTSAVIVWVEQALTVAVVLPKTITADVATGFTKFVPGTVLAVDNGSLSTVHAGVRQYHPGPTLTADADSKEIWDAADGLLVQRDDVLKSAQIDFAGDFSVGNFYVGSAGAVLVDADDDVIPRSGEDAKENKIYTDEDKAGAATARFTTTTGGTFAINVKDNTMRIPIGDYTASVTVELVEGDADDSLHQIAGPLPAGTIDRNGTSVHVAYVTHSDKYNQKLVLVNHGARPAEFLIHSLVAEKGNMAAFMLGEMAPANVTMSEDGMMVMGEIAMGQAIYLRMRDIISVTGVNPRAALTVDMSTRPQDASVATTQVNLADGSADTVRYHPLRN